MKIDERSHDAGGSTGAVVDGFRLVSMLGREPGGVESYSVVATDDETPGTLRLVPPESPPALAHRFLSHAGALAGIDHPSLPSVLAVGEAPEGAYAVTEEVRARSLASVIDGGLAPDRAIRMLFEAADALDAAHGAGLLHRDLRPANVVVGEWLIVRALLVNFGLGRARRGEFMVRDQVPYASPEELRGEEVGPPSDHYALASTVFELVTGEPPFGTSFHKARDGHLYAPPPRATLAVPGLPPAVDAVFERALAKDPDARYGTAGELVAEVEKALTGSSEQQSPEFLGQGAAAAEPELVHEPEVEQPQPEPEVEREPEPEPEPEPELEQPEPELDEGLEAELGQGAEPEWEEDFAPEPEEKLESADEVETDPVQQSARARIPVAAGVAVVAGVAVLGFLLGRGGASEDEPARSAATAGPISVQVPAGWRQVRPVPDIGGLRPRQPLAMAGTSGGRLLAGMVPGQLATFDPRTVAQRVDGSPPPATVVRLGGLRGLRWQGLRAEPGARPVTLFAVPTNRGAATLACSGRGGPRACEVAAASLRLRGVSAYSPVLAAEWRTRVRAVIGRLRARREPELTRLAQAGASSDSRRAALALAAAHRSAIREITRDAVPPQAATPHRATVAALDGLQRSFNRLGDAAQNGDPAAYASAGQSVRREDARLREALKAI